MAITQAQIVSILSIENTASLITGAATITDISNYSSIGISTPDVVKVLLYIQDPTGDSFYKNAGYDSADFSNPDLLPLTTPDSYSFTLPTDTNGDYMQGQYNVNMKVQVEQSGAYTEAYKQLYMNVCGCCNGIEANVQGDVSYNTAVVSVTDNTNYKTWTALTNVVTLYPPTNTGSSQTGTFHGSPATLTYEPPVGTFPYTGVWQWTLVSDISYTDSVSGTTTTCRLTAQGSFNVVQSQLCKVRCLLDKYRTEFYNLLRLGSLNSGQVAQQTRNYNLAMDDYLMAFASERCGLPQTTIDKYITNIYAITGIDPNCECGCGDGTSQPLVPTSIINGTDGADGSQILYGSGAPSGGTGAVGDSYIDTATGDMYLKTGASTWTFKLNIKGIQGDDGANGVSVLYTEFTDNTDSSTGAYVTLDSFAMDAAQLGTNGDKINIRATFNLLDGDASPSVRVLIGSTDLCTQSLINGRTLAFMDIWVTRTGATSGKFTYFVSFTDGLNVLGQLALEPSATGSITWANAQTIYAQVNQDIADSTQQAELTITYYHKI